MCLNFSLNCQKKYFIQCITHTPQKKTQLLAVIDRHLRLSVLRIYILIDILLYISCTLYFKKQAPKVIHLVYSSYNWPYDISLYNGNLHGYRHPFNTDAVDSFFCPDNDIGYINYIFS